MRAASFWLLGLGLWCLGTAVLSCILGLPEAAAASLYVVGASVSFARSQS